MEMLYFLFIGGSSSGKTVATCNMQHMLTRKGGVKARCGNEDVHFYLSSTRSPEIQKFRKMYDAMLDNSLPVGNIETEQYSFKLTRENQGICQIEMIDYRGALRDDPKPLPEEKAAFTSMIQRATMLVYIVPGDILEMHRQMRRLETEKDTSSKQYRILENRVDEEAGHIRSTMQGLQEGDLKRADHPPLLLYVTKSDKLPKDVDVMEELNAFIVEQNLFFPDTKILGCQSTLGKDIQIDESPNPHQITGGLEPEGFEIPILLATAHICSQSGKTWLEEELKRLHADLDDVTEEQMEARSKKVRFAFFRKQAVEDRQELIKELGNRINTLRDDIDNAKNKNIRQKYAREILAYIKDGKFPTLYLDENRNRRDIQELFD